MKMAAMNDGLGRTRIIDADTLNTEHYFESLMKQGYDKKLLSDPDIERLQYECVSLLAGKTTRYTSGDSSSVRIETARDIMASISFTIGLHLKNYINPDDAAAALQQESVQELYASGRRQIDVMLSAAKEQHRLLKSQLLDTPNIFYQSTLCDGINGFFKLYNPDFSAHSIHITADYPVFNHMPNLAGIEFITVYLNRLYLENMFCNMFSSADIHHLLWGHTKNYEEYLINLYEPVLLTALGCVVADADYRHLRLTKKEAAYLCRLLYHIKPDKLFMLLQNAAHRLISLLSCKSELAAYMHDSLPLLCSGLHLAVRHQTLHRLFVPPAYPENRPRLIVSRGQQMDHEMYRKILEEMNQCRYFSDKKAIIEARIHSLADLESVLLDGFFANEERILILQKLSIPEIAALSKRYLPLTDIDTFAFSEQKLHLRKSLHDLICALPERQLRSVKAAAYILSCTDDLSVPLHSLS